jgi:hypothetical protein
LEHIGESTINKKVIRGNALSWTRALYKTENLGNTIHKINTVYTPEKNWTMDNHIADEIKICPLCTKRVNCNLEHLHLYCENQEISNLRIWTKEKIQEELDKLKKKDENLNELQYSLEEECGIINNTSEEDFKIEDATIQEIAYMGIVSKRLVNTLRKLGPNRLLTTITLKTRMLQALINHKIKEKVKPVIQRLRSPLYKEDEENVMEKEIELISEELITQQSKQSSRTREMQTTSVLREKNEREREDEMSSEADEENVKSNNWERKRKRQKKHNGKKKKQKKT